MTLPALPLLIYLSGIAALAMWMVVVRRRIRVAIVISIVGVIIWHFLAAAWRTFKMAADGHGAATVAVTLLAIWIVASIYSLIRVPVTTPGWRRMVVNPGGASLATIMATALAWWGFAWFATVHPVPPQTQAAVAAGFGILVFFEALYRSGRVVTTFHTVTRPIPERIRIALIADIHVGQRFDRSTTRERVERILREDPDLVMISGDFLTELIPRARWQPALAPLADLADAVPVYAVQGNHDLYASHHLVPFLEQIGVTVVEGLVVRTMVGDQDVEIGGVPFTYRPREKREHLEQLHWQGAPVQIALIHDPSAWTPTLLPERSLALAGHLHGGQVGLTIGPIHLSLIRPLGMRDFGWYHRDNRDLYVTRGAGFYGFPFRLGIPNEVAIIDVQPGAS